jgi:hypothetical protein
LTPLLRQLKVTLWDHIIVDGEEKRSGIAVLAVLGLSGGKISWIQT